MALKGMQGMSSGDTFSSDALDIAIIGMAGRWPGADSVDALWHHLRNGIEMVKFFSDEELLAAGIDPLLLQQPFYVKAGATLENVTGFDARFFDYTPREAEAIDPQQRLFLEVAWAALEDAGYPPHSFAGPIGVYAGASVNTYLFNNLFAAMGNGSADDYAQIIIASDKDFLATRASYKLNLRGPSMTVQSACSTSLVATQLAVQSLLNYQCDLALAGGVSLSFPHVQGYMYQPGGILSPDGHCRPFDQHAAGTFKGNGLGIVVLKRLEEALADGDHIFAVIKGAAVNNDGNLKAGYSAPSEEGQAAVIAAAHALAEVEPDTLGYIEAHGTATPIGDPIEVAALTQAFRLGTQRKQFCALGSIKGNLGHLDAAAGVTGLIKTALALYHRELPPSLNFTSPNPMIDFANSPFYVNTALTAWPEQSTLRRAGVSSFGIGGTNVHMVLEEAPPAKKPVDDTNQWQLIALSAKSPAALDAATLQLAHYCAEHPELALADVAFTLSQRRQAFELRRFVVAQSLTEVHDLLATAHPQRLLNGRVAKELPEIAFLFPGAGSQYFNMGYELYTQLPAFQAAVNRCAEIVATQTTTDLVALMFSPATQALTPTAAETLLSLFTIEYAMAQQWLAWAIRPSMMIGHSLGEYVAACVAGVIRLEDALALVSLRGRLFDSLPEGRCLSVALAAVEVQPILPADVYLAVINSPSQCVVSGSVTAIEAFATDLNTRGIQSRLIAFNRAAHSPLLAPILAEFAAFASTIPMHQPTIPYISNVTGTWISPAELNNPHYWTRHLESTVLFDQGVQTILATGACALVEVGPGYALSSMLRRHPALQTHHTVVASGRYPQDQQSDVAVLLTAVGRLWLQGINIDWQRVSLAEGAFVRLPTYPFEHTNYCLAPLAHTVSVSTMAEGQRPSTSYQRPHLSTAYVAARNVLEQQLVDCWADVIGISEIGVHDNFFDLGGDSLLMLRLTAVLTHALERPIDPQMIFAAPTIAEFVELLEPQPQTIPALPTELVCLQTGIDSAQTPLFFIHPSGGLALCYAELARRLAPALPFYGLQARGIDGVTAPRSSITAMAESYIAAIRIVQPHGPYILGGWSMGGLIALEMAQQLQIAHEQVQLVVLLDTPVKQQGLAPEALTDSDLAWAMLGPELGISAEQFELIALSERLPQLLQLALERHYFPPGFTLTQFQHFITMFRTHAQACWDYIPRPYTGDVVLLRASETLASATAFGFAADAEFDLGWQPYLSDSFTTYLVDGSHQTLLQLPYVESVAIALQTALAQQEQHLIDRVTR